MDDLINQLMTTGMGLGLLAGGYLIWLLTGIANNLFNDKKWSWKRTFEDIAKALLWSVAIEAWVALCFGLEWFAGKCGCDIKTLMDGASVTGVIGGIIGGTIFYAVKAYKNILNFVNKSHVEVQTSEIDYEGITLLASKLLGSIFKQDDTEKVEVIVPELGGSCYYEVPVATPTDFYNAVNGVGFNEGWGFQCVAGFKEFMFSLSGSYVSAGGAASNYATAQDRVEPLGFTWHDGIDGLQDGDWAIWTGGSYGHVAMRYQGKWFGQNQGSVDGNIGNPFNLMSLPMGDIAGYYRPNIYQATPQPQPTPKPTKKTVTYTYQPGDTFGAVLIKLGLDEGHLWGEDGTVAYYTEQLRQQGIEGNIPIGTTIKLTRR